MHPLEEKEERVTMESNYKKESEIEEEMVENIKQGQEKMEKKII